MPLSNSTTIAAGTAATCSFPVVAGHTSALSGFNIEIIPGLLQTLASAGTTVTVTGLASGTMNFTLVVGVPCQVEFPGLQPAPFETAITISVPAIAGSGTGTISMWGSYV